MNPEQTTQFIIHSLSQGRNRSNIIKAICEQTGMNWEQAKLLVAQIEVEHRDKILGGRKVLFIIFAALTTLIGLGVAVGMVVATLQGWIIFFLRLPIPYLGNIAYFTLGFFVMTGGMIGLWRNIKPSK